MKLWNCFRGRSEPSLILRKEQYTDIQKLEPEIVREFIEKIVLHERSERWKKKNYIQQVDVYFNFLDKVLGKIKAVRLEILRQILETENLLIDTGSAAGFKFVNYTCQYSFIS